MERFSVVKNRSGGPGWNVIDSLTKCSVAWIYDQKYGYDHPEKDEDRAKQLAAMLNKIK